MDKKKWILEMDLEIETQKFSYVLRIREIITQ